MMKRNRLQLGLWIICGALSVVTVALVPVRGGTPAALGEGPSTLLRRLLPVIYALACVTPYYVLLRLDQRKVNTTRDHVIYLLGLLLIGWSGLALGVHRYHLSVLILQHLLAGAARFVSWMSDHRRRLRWTLLALASLCVSFGVNYALAPAVHLSQAEDYFGDVMPPDIRGQLNHFYWLWEDPERIGAQVEDMRNQNPEWDLIGRTFFGYSLANVALKYPAERDRALACLDAVIDNTVPVPWRDFLLPYGHARPFLRQPAASIMVDGEVSLMIGLRRLVSDEPAYPHRAEHARLITRCVEAIEAGPVMCGECYPDECWLFCNPLALASIKVFDVLEGTDHTDLFQRWEAAARKSLLDEETGLLKSAVTLQGDVIHEPEGSTIWIGAQCLLPVLPEFAREQYALMKKLMSGKLLCLSYGREWPLGKTGQWDIDSGFTPFGMGPASTGFGLVAAKEMGDRKFFIRLLGLLDFVGVPREKDGRLRYLSSNLVGDAIFLYAKTTGPAWEEVARRSARTKERKASDDG